MKNGFEQILTWFENTFQNSEIEDWYHNKFVDSVVAPYKTKDELKKELSDIIDSLQHEQPEVDYNKFEKLFDDFCERNKGHHITTHDACMWFWGLGLNARKEE